MIPRWRVWSETLMSRPTGSEAERLAGWCSENDLLCPKRKKWCHVWSLEEEDASCATHYRWQSSWTQTVQMSWHNHFLWPKMRWQYQRHRQESSLAKKEKKSQSFHPDSVPPHCDWENPHVFHHCLVQQRVSKGQRPTREDSPHSL